MYLKQLGYDHKQFEQMIIAHVFNTPKVHSLIVSQRFYLHQIWWYLPDKWVLISVKHSVAMCQQVYSDWFGCLRCGCGLIWVLTLDHECLFMPYKLSVTSSWWTHLRILIFHSSITFYINSHWVVGLLLHPKPGYELFQLHDGKIFFTVNCFMGKFDAKSQTFFIYLKWENCSAQANTAWQPKSYT